jgi:HlyD family secretion protein
MKAVSGFNPIKNKKLSSPALILLLVGLIGLGGFFAYQKLNSGGDRRKKDAISVPVKTEDLQVRIEASGTVTPVQAVNLSPKNAGRLVALYVDQGDRVKQEQIIARMEDNELRAQLAQAEANLAQAKARRLKARNGSRPEEIAQAQGRVNSAEAAAKLAKERSQRNLELFRQGAISKDQYDAVLTDERKTQADLEVARKALEQAQNGSRVEDIADAEAAVAQAQAQVQQTQVQLDNTVVRAPFDGIVTQKYASVGAFVTPTTSASSTSSATSTSIVAIASTLEIMAKVSESDIRQIRPGQKVEIQADAFPGKRFAGRVRLVAPEAVVDQNVTSFQVRVALETGQQELRSGMNVRLVFIGETVKDALVVPAVAIVPEKGIGGVKVVGKDGKPQFRPVTIGLRMGDQIQILKGLKPGDRVFVYLPKPPEAKRSGGGGSPLGGPPMRSR